MDTMSIGQESGHGIVSFDTEGPSFAEKWLMNIIAIMILWGLYLCSLYNFLLFHTLSEMAVILVYWAVFIVAWNCRGLMDNDYLLFLGVAYFFVGGLELMHVLAYKGMNIFHGYDANLATQLWIAARYMEGLSLLVAPLFLERRLKVEAWIMVFVLVTILVLGAVFYWHIFPACFVEGWGLTVFKKINEYLISMILVGAIYALLKKRNQLDETVFWFIMASILLAIGAEMAFTFYVSVYGLSNLAGHFLKLVSVYFIYKAIIETGLKKPYSLLFRRLKHSQQRSRESEQESRSLFYYSPISLLMVDISAIKSYIDGLRDRAVNDLGTFFEDHPDDLIRCRDLMKITGINKAAMDLYEVRTEEEFSERFSQVEASDGHRVFKMGILALCEGKTSYENEGMTQTAKGEIRQTYVRGVLLPGCEETWSKALISIVDITERKKAEAALRRSEERFRTLVETLKDPVIICSADFRVEYMNPAMIRRTGRNATGARCFKTVHDLNEKCPWCVLEKVLQGEFMESDLVSPKDNSYYHCSQFPIPGPGGSVSAVTILRDTTDQRLAEEQIRRSLKEKETLLKEIHHRVKNNMNVISSLLKLQGARVKDQEVVELLKDVRDRTKTMALIHDKLYRSSDLGHINFGEYIKDLVQGHLRTYDSGDGISIKVSADMLFLEVHTATPCALIINELISNAFKHAFPGDRTGEIRVDLRAKNVDEIEMIVSDDGIGLPAGLDLENPHSFGLEIVKLLVAQLDGTIHLESDRGTTFRIRFRR